jgi:hypothetical protein
LVLFGLVSVVGYLFSVASLVLSHDVLGMTSRLDATRSANVFAMAHGTFFRFWAYRRVVFGRAARPSRDRAPRVEDPAAA